MVLPRPAAGFAVAVAMHHSPLATISEWNERGGSGRSASGARSPILFIDKPIGVDSSHGSRYRGPEGAHRGAQDGASRPRRSDRAHRRAGPIQPGASAAPEKAQARSQGPDRQTGK